VPISKAFEASNDYLHPEARELHFDDFLNFLENLNLIVQADRALVIKHTSKNVTVLHNSDHFLNIIKRNMQKNFLEEFLVVVKMHALIEFRLKIFPNSVVFGAFWLQ
jgi:hypothetical protein